MAAFVFVSCDSGSTESEPDDTPSVPVDPDPGNPDPADPEPPVETITGVTVTPENHEILAGDSYLFKAEVSGTVADKTVIWEIAIADIDYYNKLEDGTKIVDRKGAGLLTIDGGQTPGTVITVTAKSNANPSIYGEATVTVVKPGPRLSWIPNNLEVITTGEEERSIEEEVQAIGQLLNIFGKDVSFRDGEYVEGVDYSIRRVDELNNYMDGGIIVVTGSADEGQVTVSLSGAVTGEIGPIGITLNESVLEGADKSLIDLNAREAEMVFLVKSNLLLTGKDIRAEYNTIDFDYAPLYGASMGDDAFSKEKPLGTRNLINRRVSWSGLTSTIFTDKSPAVATVTLAPVSGYSFYANGVTQEDVEPLFKKGSPVFSDFKAEKTGITFKLTYQVVARPIINGVTTNTQVAANFDDYLEDLVQPGLLVHGQTAPERLRAVKESPYYALNTPVEWTAGVAGKTFIGGTVAVAKVTIPAKHGYTFRGTNITAEYLKNVVFNSLSGDPKDPAVTIVSSEDALVFTLAYTVEKIIVDQPEIVNSIVKVNIPRAGETPDAKVTFGKNVHIQGEGNNSISWTGVTDKGKFASDVNITATVTFTTKDGYRFEDLEGDDLEENGYFDEGDIALAGDHTVTLATPTKMVIKIEFEKARVKVTDWALNGVDMITDTGLSNVIHKQGVVTEVNYKRFLESENNPTGTIGSDGSQLAGIDNTDAASTKSKFWWKNGFTQDGSNYDVDYDKDSFTHALRAKVVLRPLATYTFQGSLNSQGALDDEKKQGLAYQFRYATSPAVIPTVEQVKLNDDALEFVLVYPIAQKGIVEIVSSGGSPTFAATSVTYAGNTITQDEDAGVVTLTAKTTDPEVAGIASSGTNPSTFRWTQGVKNGQFDYNAYTGNTGKAAAQVVLKPFSPGYTFKGINTSTLDGALVDIFTLSDTEPNVTKVTIQGDNLLIDLEYDIDEAQLTTTSLRATDFVAFTSDVLGETTVPTTGLITVINTAKVILLPDESAWEGTAVSGNTIDSTSDETIIYKFALVPKAGYTFAGATANAWDAILDSAQLKSGVWSGSISGKNLNVTITWTNP
jgi:hypothetical protein